jgi:hypothetical protein
MLLPTMRACYVQSGCSGIHSAVYSARPALGTNAGGNIAAAGSLLYFQSFKVRLQPPHHREAARSM